MEQPGIQRPPAPLWRRTTPLLGLLLLWWILSRLDGDRLLAALAAVQPAAIATAALLFSANMALKALRWRRMLRAQSIALPTSVTLATFFAGQFYGQVTLGRLGELYRAEALTERGMPVGRALSSCIFDRVLDLYLVVATGGLLSALVFGERDAALWAGALLLIGTIAGLAVVAVEAGRAPVLSAPVQRLEAALSRVALLGRLLGALRDLVGGVRPLLAPGPLLESALWTLVAWCGYFGALWALAEGMGIGVGPIVLTAAATLAALTSLLPITISGLGARELIYLELLGRSGVEGERAVVLALLHLGVMTVCVLVTGALGVWARSRQPAPALQAAPSDPGAADPEH